MAAFDARAVALFGILIFVITLFVAQDTLASILVHVPSRFACGAEAASETDILLTAIAIFSASVTAVIGAEEIPANAAVPLAFGGATAFFTILVALNANVDRIFCGKEMAY